jgi:peptide/nickel transport system substrate-binding protein
VGGPFRAQPTCQILPPNFPGYRPYCPHTFDPDETGTWKGPDLDAARELVEASGTEGMEITLWSLPLRFLGVGSYMADVLRELGYVVTLEERDDPGVYFSYINNSENRVHAMLVGWFVDIPVPLGMFTILRCDSFVPGVPFNNNHAQFCDPDIDALMEEASSIEVTDPPAANALWAEVDRRLVDAAPLAPLFNRRGMDLVSTLVGNYQRHPQWAVLLDQLWVQ